MDNDFDVTSAMTNRMSLFYAHATPMLTVLSDTTSRFVSEVCTSLFLYLSLFPHYVCILLKWLLMLS